MKIKQNDNSKIRNKNGNKYINITRKYAKIVSLILSQGIVLIFVFCEFW